MPTNDSKTSTRSLYYNTENYPLCINIPHRSTYLKFDHRIDIYSRNLTNNLQSQKGGRTWSATRSTDCCVHQFQGESWISRAILCEITVWSRVRWTHKLTLRYTRACMQVSTQQHDTDNTQKVLFKCTWNSWPEVLRTIEYNTYIRLTTMNSSRWMFVWLHETSMISKCHSISITIHRSTRMNLFSDRPSQAHKRIRTTLVHTGTLTNLTSWSNQQHLSTADIAPSMQGIMKGVPVDWLWSLNGCIFDRKDYFKLKRIDRKPNYVAEVSIQANWNRFAF